MRRTRKGFIYLLLTLLSLLLFPIELTMVMANATVSFDRNMMENALVIAAQGGSKVLDRDLVRQGVFVLNEGAATTTVKALLQDAIGSMGSLASTTGTITIAMTNQWTSTPMQTMGVFSWQSASFSGLSQPSSTGLSVSQFSYSTPTILLLANVRVNDGLTTTTFHVMAHVSLVPR